MIEMYFPIFPNVGLNRTITVTIVSPRPKICIDSAEVTDKGVTKLKVIAPIIYKNPGVNLNIDNS